MDLNVKEKIYFMRHREYNIGCIGTQFVAHKNVHKPKTYGT